jgi:hypothetical protein
MVFPGAMVRRAHLAIVHAVVKSDVETVKFGAEAFKAGTSVVSLSNLGNKHFRCQMEPTLICEGSSGFLHRI